jgi:hypothetical protein
MKIDQIKTAQSLIKRYQELNERLTNFKRYGNEVIKDASFGLFTLTEAECSAVTKILLNALSREMEAVKKKYEEL